MIQLLRLITLTVDGISRSNFCLYRLQSISTSSFCLLKKGELLVGKLYTFSQGISVYILRCIKGVTALSSVHSMYTLGMLPKFSSVSCSGVMADCNGSWLSNTFASSVISSSQSAYNPSL